ncbi:hypothetical protein F4780DRAFT_745106 [Xylariomycetidae sp. FL0641]|nr:hypothetical protein F4780DRAFT_745106 [Xylariomycetidae sp. FL0641]
MALSLALVIRTPATCAAARPGAHDCPRAVQLENVSARPAATFRFLSPASRSLAVALRFYPLRAGCARCEVVVVHALVDISAGGAVAQKN